MRRLLLAAFFLLLAAPSGAQDDTRMPIPGAVGLGLVAGDPAGGTAKWWFGPSLAAEAGLGFSGSAALWAGLVAHKWGLLPDSADGKSALHLGVSGRWERDDLGLRLMFGADYWRFKLPVELYAEAGPVFYPGGPTGVDGGAGLRWYFTPTR